MIPHYTTQKYKIVYMKERTKKTTTKTRKKALSRSMNYKLSKFKNIKINKNTLVRCSSKPAQYCTCCVGGPKHKSHFLLLMAPLSDEHWA